MKRIIRMRYVFHGYSLGDAFKLHAKLSADFYGATGFIEGGDDRIEMEIEGNKDAISSVVSGLNAMPFSFIAKTEVEKLKKMDDMEFDIL